MLFKEVDDCETCPIKKEGLCNAGMFNPNTNSSYEPICDGFDPDEDVFDIIENLYSGRKIQADIEAKRIRREKEREERLKLGIKRWHEARARNAYENREIARLGRLIQRNGAFMRLGEAFSIVSGTKAGESESSALEAENRKFRERIAELQAIKKEKAKKLREQRKADEENDRLG